MVKYLIFGVYLLRSGFLVESLKSNKNLQKRSLVLTLEFSNVNSPNIIKIYSPNTATNMSLVDVRKNICTALLPGSPITLEPLGNQVSVYSCKSP